MDSFLPYARQSIDEEDIAQVADSLKKNLITRGPIVEEFEKKLAAYCGARFAVAFNSGTSALMAAYAAVDAGPGDRVLSTPNTFVSTVGAAIARQAVPIFIDIDRCTGGIDLEQLAINLRQPFSRGRMIIAPVHFSGIAVDMKQLGAEIRNAETLIIEDAAHAIGSSYPSGEKVGSCAFSDMTIFSFHPAKTLTTGEGGMVTTNDEKLYHRLMRFRNNGIERDPAYFHENVLGAWYYEVQELTGNFNFTEFQAALGLSQYARLDQFIEKRRHLIKIYRELLTGMESVKMFTDLYDAHTAFHLCVVQIEFEKYKTNRTEVMQKLHSQGIGTQCHYIPVYRLPFFKQKGGDLSPYFPEMETYFSQALSLPLYADLQPEEVARVVKALIKILEA